MFCEMVLFGVIFFVTSCGRYAACCDLATVDFSSPAVFVLFHALGIVPVVVPGSIGSLRYHTAAVFLHLRGLDKTAAVYAHLR